MVFREEFGGLCDLDSLGGLGLELGDDMFPLADDRAPVIASSFGSKCRLPNRVNFFFIIVVVCGTVCILDVYGQIEDEDLGGRN